MKYVIAIVALFVCCRVVACVVHYDTDAVVVRVLKKGGGINLKVTDYDALCEKLKSADAELVIHHWEGLIGDNEVAVVDVWVANREESAFSSDYTMAARYDGAASVDPDDLLYAATTEAIKGWTSEGELDATLADIRVSEHEHRLADALIDRYRARKAHASKRAH
ncbi:MAG: hypothetical protein ACRES9_01465 [Gammaproteobacteria bacterium]